MIGIELGNKSALLPNPTAKTKKPSMPIRINLWSSPRNISTALMYSFAQRPDTTVVDEPLYAYYLTHATDRAEHPGHEDILASQSADGRQVVESVILGGDYTTEVVVFKQMTHHMLDLPLGFLHQTHNVLLIRDPQAILASYTKVIGQPTAYDIGVPQQDALFTYLQAHDALTAIVDAKVLLQHPRRTLELLCGRLGIPFTEAMLAWEAGPRPEDGVWAPHWYSTVHASTGFAPYQEKKVSLPPEIADIAAQCRPFYEKLLASDAIL